MTVKITLMCDAYGCINSKEIQGCTDSDIEAAGFHPNPYDGEDHYCSKCWPQVKAELEEDEV